jgi:hopanoid biosynthesis associated protein HpnK
VSPPPQRLIVNADDFGRSASINEAVIRAHREGILTTASLMVNEGGCAEAVALAKENPRLGVGLHLSLLCGRSACPPAEIPGLVDARGRFTDSPVAAGWRYFFRASLKPALASEIAAQLTRFKATGLELDHLNGHLHLHLHPVVIRILARTASEFGFKRIRLTRDPFWLSVRLARGRWLYRISHALIFSWLAARARRLLDDRNVRYTRQVFGLLQNARVDEDYVCRLLAALPPGDSELYSHPSLDEFRHEFDALVSSRVRAAVAGRDIELIRYRDL